MAEQQKKEEVQLTPEEQKIEAVQKKIDDLSDKISLEIRAVEKKFAPERDPLIKERREAIAAIPDFWKKALIGHPAVASLMSTEDAEIMDYLIDLDVEEIWDDLDSFRLTMKFKEGNPYFTNTSIQKTFRWNKDKDDYDVEASKIEWVADKNLAEKNKKLEETMQKKEDDGVFEEGEDFESWFGAWETIGEDDEITEYIRDEIWVQPLKFYALFKHDLEDDEGEGAAKEQQQQ